MEVGEHCGWTSNAREYIRMKEGLKDYLDRYVPAKRRKVRLDQRLSEAREEMNHPLRGVRLTGMPHGSGENLGAAAIPLRESELSNQLNDQKILLEQIMNEIMRVLNVLDITSYERTVMEMKYIDGEQLENIRQEDIPYCRTTVYKLWNDGLDILLENDKVRTIIREYLNNRHKKHFC